MKSEWNSQDRNLATREFTEFLTSYTHLLEFQLNDVRKHMAETVSEVMTGIEEISRKHGEKTHESAPLSSEHHKNDKENDTSVQKSKKFSAHMDSLENLDSRVHGLLVTMMGALSADDMVGQRLAHVNYALRILKDTLSGTLNTMHNPLQLAEIRKMHQDLAKKVFDSYSMEDERNIFKKIYQNKEGSP
ncbi:MAG: hypothetical protein H6618_01145 [Deltaproteobacteria bacterium]|nr:hypothetical protein [Deltaproteobacteria bacterium]